MIDTSDEKIAATNDEATPSDVDEVDAFALISNKGKKKKRKSKRKAVRISIASVPDKQDATVSELPPVTASSVQSNLILDGDDAEECDGDISFFSETHEAQDVDNAENHSSRMKVRLNVELQKLEDDKAEDMAKINAYLIAKWEERTDTLNKQVLKIRRDMMIKQSAQRAQLAEKHKTQQELDKRKIDEGRKWLIERQQQQLTQEAGQTGKSGSNITEEWNNMPNQLQTRHSFQLKQFEVKEATMKERSANDASAQNKILEAHHRKRSAEADAFIENLIKNCQQRQKNLKATLNRLHEQRFEARKREIKITFSKPFESPASEQKGVEPHSHKDLGNYLDNSFAHTAVLRHKHRKHNMNGTTVQIAVDIHNEGLFLMARSTHENENSLSSFGNVSNTAPGIGTIVTDDSSGRPCLFIPWGAKARSFLYSIVCGEIPNGYGLEKATAGSTSSQKLLDGGLVKCMITHTRTSQETATRDRALSYPRIQKLANTASIENATQLKASYSTRTEELESDITNLSLREQKIALAHREAAQNLERSKAAMDKLKIHVQQFFGNDGLTPSPNLNPESRQKILSTMYRYKTSYENSKKEESALREPLELSRKVLVSKKEELGLVKQEIQKLEAFMDEIKSKSGMDNMIDKRAENVINAICQVAQSRRAHVNHKKSSSDPIHDIHEDDKKSFAQKMARRRIVTMLRPTQVGIVNQVKDMVTKSSPEVANIDPKLRAEELLLLSLYPQADEALSPVPPDSDADWAEPGWQLNLSPPEEGNPHSILPLDQVGRGPRNFLSVCCSSGRQTAALVQQRHLSMLEGPLSFVSKASAPAEMTSKQPQTSGDPVMFDPLSITEEEMSRGYSFVLRPPKNALKSTNESEQMTPAKRKTTTDDDTPKKEAKARRHSQTQIQADTISPNQPLQQQMQQQNQLMQQQNQLTQQQNQQMQQQIQPTQQQIQPMQQSNQQMSMQLSMLQSNQQMPMQPNQQVPMQPNQAVALPNNNVVNRNQSFMNMSPEQYQWMLQQHQLRLQQQQQQIQLQQFQNQQQLQQRQLQNNTSVNQGQTNNAPHSHQQQNNRR